MKQNTGTELTYEGFAAFLREVSNERFEEEELRSMWNSIEAVRVSRTYRDNLFRMIYRDKEKLLSLYNAMNGTDYRDTDELIITTLENAIYIGIKNDLSFIIASELNLYEHQSTTNPNIPLRQLQYVTTILRGLVSQKALYSTKLTKIPYPRFVVFYNGEQEEPERHVLKLSDAYLKQEGEPELELKVTMLNINCGKNKELMENCESLRDYAIFNDKVRNYRKSMPVKKAVNKAVEECINEGILEDFLRKNRAEVMAMDIFTYDQKLHEEVIAEEAEERGLERGIERGEMIKLISLTVKKLKKGKTAEIIAGELEEEEAAVNRICEAAQKAAPEYDVNKIYEIMNKE